MQSYASLQDSATPLEPTAPMLPNGTTPELPPLHPDDPDFQLLHLVGVLLNIHYLTHNAPFVQRYGYRLTGSMHRLIQGVSRAIGEVDSVVLEALASHPVQD